MSRKNDGILAPDGVSSTDSTESAISSIDRAASILVCLSHGVSTITELAKSTKLNKSTVHRLLNTLVKPRFVSYDSANHRYYLGPLITRLSSNQQVTHQYLVICAMHEMRRLAVVTDETINLTLLIGTDLTILYNIPSRYGIKVYEDLERGGEVSILPFGSSAKVLFSQLSEEGLTRTLDSIAVFHAHLSELVDIPNLKEQLQQIRKNGFAISQNERILGALSVSAPVKNYSCPISLNVMGSEGHMLAKLPKIVEELKTSATLLSAEILKSIH